MANFQAQIEGITSVSTGTTPTTTELSTFLTDGAKDLINKIINIKPDEAFKFATETLVSDNAGTAVAGKLLSVVRENNSTTDVRPATPIPASLRYLATDTESLSYRSRFNPCYYTLNGKVYVLPAPTDSNNQALISQINYPTIAHTNDTADNLLPDEYEHLVVLYASAMTCQAVAAEIQNNMPTAPNASNYGLDDIPFYDSANEENDVKIPSLPVYVAPNMGPDLNTSGVLSSLSSNDLEAFDRQINMFEKNLDLFKEKLNIAEKDYNNDLKEFDSELETLTKNADRKLQAQASEYRSKVYRYQYYITEYSQLITEKMTKYKWYMEQYVRLMNQYNAGIAGIAQQQKPTKDDVRAKAPREEMPQQQEGEEYGG
tara:strand:+ start:2049 stop:3167 length:1119 start_codon:yes stop_codon:yes gene_type:complete